MSFAPIAEFEAVTQRAGNVSGSPMSKLTINRQQVIGDVVNAIKDPECHCRPRARAAACRPGASRHST
jgi:hypothetical protein